MRPLPALSPVDPSQPVFDQQQDDFLSLFASDFSQMDSLQSALGDQQNTLGSSLDPIGSALDNIDGIIADIGSIFDSLSSGLDLIDLTGNIVQAQSFDDALDNNLNNYTPNVLISIGQFLYDILKEVYTYLIVPLFNLIVAALQAIWDAITYLLSAFAGSSAPSFTPTGFEFTFDFSF